jgi:hypothetical protein
LEIFSPQNHYLSEENLLREPSRDLQAKRCVPLAKYIVKKIIHIYIFLIASLCHSQTKVDSIAIKENLVWLQKLEKISLKKDKIDFVIQKIKSDSIYKDATVSIATYSPLDGHIHPLKGNEVYCKIVFVLTRKKKAKILNLNKSPSYSRILKYLNSTSINKITILESITADSFFGNKGKCGVVYLETSDKRLMRLVK